MIRIVTLLLALSLLAACSQMKMRGDYGYSNENNRRVQLVDPFAPKADIPEHTVEGKKVEIVIKNYRKETGKAKKAELLD